MESSLPSRWVFVRIAVFCGLATAMGCAGRMAQKPGTAVRAPVPIRIAGLDIQERERARTLTGGERLREQQSFAIRLESTRALHLYVVLEHPDRRRELLYPHPGDPLAAATPGPMRVPRADDWFSVEQTEPGDKLCLIGSEAPSDQLACTEEETKRSPDRGEDTPPPPAKEGETHAPPSAPPPDDRDGSRGRGRWVIGLPLVAR